MFALIVEELNRRNAAIGPDEMFLIEGLAAHLARIREVNALIRFGSEIASAAEAIRTKRWILACEFAAALQLPEDSLKRLGWVN